MTIIREPSFTLKLTEEEVNALTKFIGKTSHDSRKRLGLSEEQSRLVGDMYGPLDASVHGREEE